LLLSGYERALKSDPFQPNWRTQGSISLGTRKVILWDWGVYLGHEQ